METYLRIIPSIDAQIRITLVPKQLLPSPEGITDDTVIPWIEQIANSERILIYYINSLRTSGRYIDIFTNTGTEGK